jgi:hypothetical protein
MTETNEPTLAQRAIGDLAPKLVELKELITHLALETAS